MYTNMANEGVKENHETPLHHAVARGDCEAIESLIAKDENINSITENGETPLHYLGKISWFQRDCTLQILKLLIENGANVNAATVTGETLLHLLAKESYFSQVDTIKELIENGANVNAITLANEAPIDLAVKYKNGSALKIFLNKRAVVTNYARTEIKKNFYKSKSALKLLNEDILQSLEEAKKRSDASKKPMLILSGERHNEMFYHLCEVASITAAFQFGIKRFCYEYDDCRHTAFVNAEERDLQDNSWGNIYLFLKKLGLKLQPIDQGTDGYKCVPYQDKIVPVDIISGKAFSPTDEQGIRYRNEIMAAELKKQSQDSFAVIGLVHADDLKKLLIDDFEIVELNSMFNENARSNTWAADLVFGRGAALIRDHFLGLSKKIFPTEIENNSTILALKPSVLFSPKEKNIKRKKSYSDPETINTDSIYLAETNSLQQPQMIKRTKGILK